MVEITLHVEGGVLNNVKLIEDTQEHRTRRIQFQKSLMNTQRLRLSLYKLLSQGIDNQAIRVKIELGSGEKQTVTFFKSQPNAYLLIDMDGKKESRSKRLAYFGLEQDNVKDKVYFMIQKMEAWILSQPDKIEETFFINRKTQVTDSIENYKTIKNKHPKQIINPDDVLKVILRRFFKDGEGVDLKYGKLSTAPLLLENLDIQRLRKTFEDVDKLLIAINTEGPL
jgi:phosphatidate phosphatase PAH1